MQIKRHKKIRCAIIEFRDSIQRVAATLRLAAVLELGIIIAYNNSFFK